MYIGTTEPARSAPPGLRGRRQLDRRGDGRATATRILVTLRADGGVSVVDNGRGIPVKPIPKAKDRRPAVEVVLTTLNAGGKFGGGGYRISGGLHGVGVSVVNALSERLIVEVAARRVPRGTRSYARGKATTQARRRASPRTQAPARRSRSGPTREIFDEGVEFKREMLAERLQELAFLTAGVEIQLDRRARGQPGEGGLQGHRAGSPTS